MIKLLQDGHIDIVSETALSALLFEEEAGAEILLLEWKKGVAAYHTVFFCAYRQWSTDAFRFERMQNRI